jgi:hypothetical protein
MRFRKASGPLVWRSMYKPRFLSRSSMFESYCNNEININMYTNTHTHMRGSQIFHKSRHHLQRLGARRGTWSKVHTVDPQFWTHQWISLMVYVNWYTLLYVRQENCNKHAQSISTTAYKLVAQYSSGTFSISCNEVNVSAYLTVFVCVFPSVYVFLQTRQWERGICLTFRLIQYVL